MPVWSYPVALATISLLVMTLEWRWPARPDQSKLRKGLLSDVLYLVFNGQFLGLALASLAGWLVLPLLDSLMTALGWSAWREVRFAETWSLWLQIPFVLVGLDFLQWCVHRLLHGVSWLWPTHQVHHSVADGEMDWIVSFRFQWTEVVVYRTVQYLPLVLFGFSNVALFVHAVFGTLIGHLNHANLAWDYGPLRYVLNNPKMHLWHHDYDARRVVNFGIIFSSWDWMFGTADVPDHPPRKLGFPGSEALPRGFWAQALHPVTRASLPGWLASALGILAIGGFMALALRY